MKRLGPMLVRAGFVLGLGLLGPSLPEADASFLPSFDGSTSGVYNYRLNFTTAVVDGTAVERLDPYGGPIPPSGTIGASGGFATIYDILGLTSVTVPANFQFTIQNIGINPDGTGQPDNPGFANVSFYYTGPTLLADTSFTGFVINSSIPGGLTQLGRGAGQTTRNEGPSAGTSLGFTNRVSVPMIPEPASIALVGLGGLVVLAYRRRRAV